MSTPQSQRYIFFPWFLYPSLFVLWWDYINFISICGGGGIIMKIFIADLLYNISKSCKILTMPLKICLIFLMSFPVLSICPCVSADVYRQERNYFHPWLGVWQKLNELNYLGSMNLVSTLWFSMHRLVDIAQLICFWFYTTSRLT